MNTHTAALIEAVKLGRQALAKDRDQDNPVSTETTIRNLAELLGSEAVSDALVALDRVDDAPSMKSDPPVDLRVPYPWRARRPSHLRQRTG